MNFFINLVKFKNVKIMSNLTNNRIDTVISGADLAVVNGSIDAIEATLSFLIGLTEIGRAHV